LELVELSVPGQHRVGTPSEWYSFHMNNQVPNRWETKNLLIQDATVSEISDLQAVYDNCAYIGEWTGAEGEDAGYMQAEFEKKHLPPEGKPDLHRLQSIKLKSNGKIVGYTVLYHGFPDEQTLWIAILAIHTDYQGKRFGQEIVTALLDEARKLEVYTRLGLTVGIKNWSALRFWINAGFTTILKLNGDKIYSEETYADLWLTQDLNR
jgi:diamine N-acetyltransferase